MTLRTPRRSWTGRGIRSATHPFALCAALAGAPLLCDPDPARGQVPFEGEVRQLVTFRFLPGRSADAMKIYVEDAVPLYRAGTAMRSFRGLREVESPIPLDLVVVSSFAGMAGMDRSNEELRELAAESGSSLGSIYGAIAALSSGHDDQFVTMLPELGRGDATSRRLVALVWYQVLPGTNRRFERALADLAEWEEEQGWNTSTGRFLVSEGWTHLRFLGVESLEDYQTYWEALDERGEYDRLREMTGTRREVILAPVPELAVR
jgi:hypothetical protein